MILRLGPKRLIWIAFILLLLGVIFPFLMVMRIIPSTIFLNFLSFFLSLAGMVLGFIGTGLYIMIHRKKKDD
jgi:hypothetical protein